MKQILPIILLLPFFIIYSGKVSARDTDQIGKELENINYSEIPYGVNLKGANIQITPTPGVTSVPLKGETKLIEGHMVKEGNLRSYEKETEVSTDIFASFLRGLNDLFTSIGNLFNFGNQKAVNWVGTMTPCGVADKALGAENPNCKNGKIVINNNGVDRRAENDDTKVLGIINTAPMDKGLDLAYCMQMPYGTGDCLSNNTPFTDTSKVSVPVSPTQTKAIINPAVSVTPVSVQPTSAVFPPGTVFPASINNDLTCANKPPGEKLREIIKQAAEWKGIPPAVLASYACVEGGGLWSLSDDEVDVKSQEGGKYKTNCTPNECAAAGPLQMTVGIDNNNDPKCWGCPGAVRLGSCPNQWKLYGNASKKALGRSITDVCNISDALFAAAEKIAQDKNIKDQYAKYDNSYAQYCLNADDDWDNGNLLSCITGAYYGECKPCQLEDDGTYDTYACNRFYKAFGVAMNYCEFVINFSRQWEKVY